MPHPQNVPITDTQIRALRDEARRAGDNGHVAIALAALGRPHYRVVAVLPDGQTFGDEAHVGQCAGFPFDERAGARAIADDLAAHRPDGHGDVRYEVREIHPDREWARAECARVIADLPAGPRMTDRTPPLYVEWQPIPLRPWVVRLADGRVVRRFDTVAQARVFLAHPDRIRRALRALGATHPLTPPPHP
jgi:hypothetical protein